MSDANVPDPETSRGAARRPTAPERKRDRLSGEERPRVVQRPDGVRGHLLAVLWQRTEALQRAGVPPRPSLESERVARKDVLKDAEV